MAMLEVTHLDAFRARLATHLERSAEEMIDAISSAMFADLGPYQQLAGPGEVDRLRGNIRSVLVAFRRLVAGQDPLTAAELAQLNQTGARRAQQGIPLDAVTESVEIAMRVTWRFVRDSAHVLTAPSAGNRIDGADAAAAVADLAVETRDFMHELVTALVTGYRMEREHGDSGRAQAAADLVSEILEGRWGNPRRLRQAGRALGYEIAEPLVVALVAGPDPMQNPDDSLFGEVAAVLPSAVLSRVRRTPSPHVAVIVPQAEGAGPDWVLATLESSPVARRAVAFVDTEARDLTGLPRAYEALVRELPAARVMAHGCGVVSPRDTELLRLLSGLPLAARLDFVRGVLHPILELAPGKAAEALNTLHAYFRGRGRLDETAADLQLHRNSFRYRLDRAQALLGVSFRDGTDRLKVEVALVLHGLARQEAVLLDKEAGSGAPG